MQLEWIHFFTEWYINPILIICVDDSLMIITFVFNMKSFDANHLRSAWIKGALSLRYNYE